MKRLRSTLPSLFLVLFFGCDNGAEVRRVQTEKAADQVQRITEQLDRATNEAGIYDRAAGEKVQENDPWGTQIRVTYSQGGVAETVTVRSAGPDRQFHTSDDLLAQGAAVNFKGIGEGIKNNAEATAANASKGAVKGTIDGVKESLKNSLPFGKKKADETTTESATEENVSSPSE